MARKQLWLGSVGPLLFDDANMFADGRTHGLASDKTPTEDEDVVRLIDLNDYAPVDAEYLVVSLNNTLTSERSLNTGHGISGTDNGANNTFQIDVVDSEIDHDALTNFVANEHIDWTGASQNFKTTGTLTVGNVTNVAPLHLYVNSTGVNNAGLQIEQGGAGDALLEFVITSAKKWAMGIDNDDADTFKISPSADVGSGWVVKINNTSLVFDGYLGTIADLTTDTAPADDTTEKRMSLQKLASPPSNAAYIAFSNNPGTDTFYLVMEEA